MAMRGVWQRGRTGRVRFSRPGRIVRAFLALDVSVAARLRHPRASAAAPCCRSEDAGHPERVTEPLDLFADAEGSSGPPRDLETVRAEAAGCTRCELYQDTTQTVFGVGPTT